MNIEIIESKYLNILIVKKQCSVVDVREPYEYELGHISESKLIPLGNLSIEDLNNLIEPIIFYCAVGRRSVHACIKILANNPDKKVFSLTGGIYSWQANGFKLVK